MAPTCAVPGLLEFCDLTVQLQRTSALCNIPDIFLTLFACLRFSLEQNRFQSRNGFLRICLVESLVLRDYWEQYNFFSKLSSCKLPPVMAMCIQNTTLCRSPYLGHYLYKELKLSNPCWSF